MLAASSLMDLEPRYVKSSLGSTTPGTRTPSSGGSPRSDAEKLEAAAPMLELPPGLLAAMPGLGLVEPPPGLSFMAPCCSPPGLPQPLSRGRAAELERAAQMMPPGLFLQPPAALQLVGVSSGYRHGAPPPALTAAVGGWPTAVAAPADAAAREGIAVRAADDGAGLCVEWAVKVQRLRSKDKQIVSQEVLVDLPSRGPTPFKLFLVPHSKGDKKGQNSFLQARGRGRVAIKCCAQLTEGEQLPLSIAVANGAAAAAPADIHDFARHSHWEPKQPQVLDFAKHSEGKETFSVSVFIREGSL